MSLLTIVVEPGHHTRYTALSEMRASGSMCSAAITGSIWANLEREQIFGQGSADTVTMQIIKYKNNRYECTAALETPFLVAHRVVSPRIVCGSVCSDQPEFNLPGNLRVLSTEDEHVSFLEGHKVNQTLPNGQTQGMHITRRRKCSAILIFYVYVRVCEQRYGRP